MNSGSLKLRLAEHCGSSMVLAVPMVRTVLAVPPVPTEPPVPLVPLMLPVLPVLPVHRGGIDGLSKGIFLFLVLFSYKTIFLLASSY